MKYRIIFLIVGLQSLVQAQSILLQPAFRRKVVFKYENDLFALTDRYYTQGIYLNYSEKSKEVGEFWNKSVDKYTNLNFAHQAFTPSTIKSDSILQNDRPYAASFSAYLDRTLVDQNGNFSVSFGIELGGVGPFAQGKQMQIAIHKATNNFLPLGWQYQISNGLILDGYLKSEYRLLELSNWFNLNGGLDIEIGAFRNNLKPNLILAIGDLKSKRNFFYSKSSLALLGRDGTLQGSLIGGKNEVVVSKSDVNRLVFQEELGLKLGFEHFQFSLNYCLQSKTFEQQLSSFHAWGGIGLVYQM